MSKSQPVIQFSADRTVIHPGEHATLRWRVEGVKAVYVFREGQPWQEHGVVGQGERQVSPSQTTTYRMRVIKADDSAEVHKIEIQVQAHKASQAFSVDRTEIHPGECVTFRWLVEGVRAVYFFPDGERWQDHGVVGVGQQQVCPPQTTTYCLRIVKADDSAEVHKIEIQVRAQGPSQTFSVDRIEIDRGECVTFRWHVEGVQAVYFFPQGARWQDHGVVGVGEQQVCPPQTTTYCLRVLKVDDSVEIHYLTVQVRG
jgi:plastocyanin